MRKGGIIEILIAVLLALAGGALLGFLIRKFLGEARVQSAESAARRLLEDAEKQAERRQKEALLEVKDEIHSLRKETERELKERRNELQVLERRVIQKEETLDNRIVQLDKREEGLRGKEQDLVDRRDQLDGLIDDEKVALERISGMSGGEAKDLLLKKVEEEVKHESAQLIREIESKAREEADRRAQNIVSLAIQRCASDQVAEMTVSVVNLPGDEMKGRIIGREGRNIRAIETLTGINLIIDDTPEAVIISGFDPVRREIARITLEKLIADGRIHPARIEEMFEKARSEVEVRIREAGEAAALETDVHGLHPELVKVLGRLHFRTSYGQNVLKHIVESTHIAGMMAAEMGVDVRLVKRATLLHDVGKAVDHEIEGSHASIGADLAKRLGESPAVCHAIAAHHGETEPQTVEAVLVQAADAVSAARPGARRETLESYIKRLEKLETIAESYDGVEKSYAMQAGREIRIMVRPEQVDDDDAVLLARSIARQIEDELVYPGQIKVTVIRENRAVEYAK